MGNHWPLSEETQEPMSSLKVGHAVAHWAKNGSGLVTNQGTDSHLNKNTITNTDTDTNTNKEKDRNTDTKTQR